MRAQQIELRSIWIWTTLDLADVTNNKECRRVQPRASLKLGLPGQAYPVGLSRLTFGLPL